MHPARRHSVSGEVGANGSAWLTSSSRHPYTGWDRQVVQTGAEAKQLKGSINSEWIYPPVDDAELILSHADYHTTWPTAGL